MNDSSKPKKNIAKNDLSENYINFDFETYREKIKADNNQEKLYEINSELNILNQTKKGKIAKIMILKYLFISPNGDLSNIIYCSGNEIVYKGKIMKDGKITLSSKEYYSETKKDIIKDYNGLLALKNGKIQYEGKVDDKTFCFEIVGSLWNLNLNLQNSEVKIALILSYQNDSFTGFSLDARGVSLWLGYEGNDNHVNLIQEYIEENIDNDVRHDRNIYSYSGKYDKINQTIEGIVSNPKIEKGKTFNLKKI